MEWKCLEGGRGEGPLEKPPPPPPPLREKKEGGGGGKMASRKEETEKRGHGEKGERKDKVCPLNYRTVLYRKEVEVTGQKYPKRQTVFYPFLKRNPVKNPNKSSLLHSRLQPHVLRRRRSHLPLEHPPAQGGQAPLHLLAHLRGEPIRAGGPGAGEEEDHDVLLDKNAPVFPKQN